jgi:spore maturation protein A
MLNKIWFGLLVIGLVYGFGKAAYQTAKGENRQIIVDVVATASSSAVFQQLTLALVPGETALVKMGRQLSDSTIDGAKTAVDLVIVLIGVMTLWLGLMNIAKDAGLVDAFARLLRPLMRWLFPGIPNGHPAQGAILMNLSANMIGLDNAATPMGLKAMTEMQTLNPVKDTATNSMAMFLAINNSSVTLIPISIIAIRKAMGSPNPTEPLAGTLIATTISTVSAVFITRWLARRTGYYVPPERLPESSEFEPTAEGVTNG